MSNDRHRRAKMLLAAASGLLLAAGLDVSSAQSRDRERPYTTWRTYGGGAHGSQYSALDQIDKSNVTQLEVVWSFPAGERSFVFRDLGEGRLKPQRVELGMRAGDDVVVLSGLSEGDAIVTSGNFLVAAESRLKLAMEQWQ